MNPRDENGRGEQTFSARFASVPPQKGDKVPKKFLRILLLHSRELLVSFTYKCFKTRGLDPLLKWWRRMFVHKQIVRITL
jgi:hypothetical protein